MPLDFSKLGITIADDRGNILTAPLRGGQPSGTYRTVVNGTAPKSILHKVGDSTPGSTPREAYYIQGSASTDKDSGLPVEMGLYPEVATPVGMANLKANGVVVSGKTLPMISRTDLTNNNQFDVIEPFLINDPLYTPLSFSYSPGKILTTPTSKNEDSEKSAKAYKESDGYSGTAKAQRDFLHYLDSEVTAIPPNPQSPIDHLASFVQTSGSLEDPTYLGYDIIIDTLNSPLFNGSILDFIRTMDNKFSDPDIKAREEIWRNFCGDFFSFFHSNTSVSTDFTKTVDTDTPPLKIPNRLDRTNAKPYYLKKLGGLDKLVEKEILGANDSTKAFVDYGKDVITLGLYEDVRLSTGTLAFLYKSLAWSRVKGKQIIPENLLRFDVNIEITEIRNFNRVMKEVQSGNLNIYADIPPKYIYTLYDCQFEFKDMSHPGEIDMTEAAKQVDAFDISFNYKFSTLKLQRFVWNTNTSSFNIHEIDNGMIGASSSIVNRSGNKQEPSYTISRNITAMTASSALNSYKMSYAINQYQQQNIKTQSPSVGPKQDSLFKRAFEGLVKNVEKAIDNRINTDLTIQYKLLNETLENIRNSIGFGRMSEPTNVYETNPLKDDLKNAFRDFVGQSIKGFFSGDI
jgi:hypothetical protein